MALRDWPKASTVAPKTVRPQHPARVLARGGHVRAEMGGRRGRSRVLPPAFLRPRASRPALDSPTSASVMGEKLIIFHVSCLRRPGEGRLPAHPRNRCCQCRGRWSGSAVYPGQVLVGDVLGRGLSLTLRVSRRCLGSSIRGEGHASLRPWPVWPFAGRALIRRMFMHGRAGDCSGLRELSRGPCQDRRRPGTPRPDWPRPPRAHMIVSDPSGPTASCPRPGTAGGRPAARPRSAGWSNGPARGRLASRRKPGGAILSSPGMASMAAAKPRRVRRTHEPPAGRPDHQFEGGLLGPDNHHTAATWPWVPGSPARPCFRARALARCAPQQGGGGPGVEDSAASSTFYVRPGRGGSPVEGLVLGSGTTFPPQTTCDIPCSLTCLPLVRPHNP